MEVSNKWSILRKNCRVRVAKLVEAENEAIPVEVENGTWYNPFKGYGWRHSPFLLRRSNYGTKEQKRPNIDLIIKPSRDTVGYIRLSVRDKDPFGFIETQKLIIEEWGHQHQIPISHNNIDNRFSGKRFDRPAFQKMIQDILADTVECIIVKDLSQLGRNYITVRYYLV